MTPMEGCLYLGVRNTFMVPVGWEVDHRQYNKSFTTLRQVGWECYDAGFSFMCALSVGRKRAYFGLCTLCLRNTPGNEHRCLPRSLWRRTKNRCGNGSHQQHVKRYFHPHYV